VLLGLLVAGLEASTVMPAAAQTSGTWAATGSLNTARSGNTATRLANGQVLVSGGQSSGGATLASAELYNPASGKWTVTGSMANARSNHTATLLPNGEVLVAGGQDGTGSLASAEIYNPSTGQWSATGSMTLPRSGQGATLLQNGQVLVLLISRDARVRFLLLDGTQHALVVGELERHQAVLLRLALFHLA